MRIQSIHNKVNLTILQNSVIYVFWYLYCMVLFASYQITRRDVKVLCLELFIYIYVVISVVDECCRLKTVNWLMLQQ